jgi:hypothetical protein
MGERLNIQKADSETKSEIDESVVAEDVDKCTRCGGNIVLVRKCRVCEKCGISPVDELNEPDD